MKKSFSFIIALLYFLQASASHISGGELFYEYLGTGSTLNTNKYKVTLRLFSDCHPLDPEHSQKIEDEIVVIGIYDNKDSSLQSSPRLTLNLPIQIIELNSSSIPCLTSAPDVCFKVGIFTSTVDLPTTEDGYTLTWIRCCRPNGIGNLAIASGAGGTFTTSIPGTSALTNGVNSSPEFLIKDTALVCQNRNFVLDFGASDPDNDSISYAFCDAYQGGTELDPDPGAPGGGGIPTTLQLLRLPYKLPYTGNSPLGPAVRIDAVSGKITGTAPASGRYVINVCATEWRNGKAINIHRKDFILEVGNCDFAAAEPSPVTGVWCKDFAVQFTNNNPSSAIQSYHWDFGVPNATSEAAAPVYTYEDTGVYTIKLTVQGAGGCVDEATTTIGVYPGLKSDFNFVGSCFKSPFNFKDQSSTRYGTINNWTWYFNDPLDPAGLSTVQNPDYKFSDSGTRDVQLIVTNSKGCTDSITKTIHVNDIAALSLPFKDTLICSVDTLPIKGVGTGTFTWSPAYNIINAASSDPMVFPKRTTTYVATIKDVGGCVSTDSLTVNVLDSINVIAHPDTTICLTDSLVLHAESSGLQYGWTPSESLLSSSNIKNPIARPDTTTTYTVTANLGKCLATDFVTVKVVPYPRSAAGDDVTICYGNWVQLFGSIGGSSFNWSPENSLSNPHTLTPVASPLFTMAYTLAVVDTLGCPKPSYDTVVVNVTPPVRAFAGNDTAIIAGQPLQLNATGGSSYTWSPSIGMNNTSIADPVVILSGAYDSVLYKVRVAEGECFAEDEIKVKVFKTSPDLFIPTAFTPNADGRNDILKPVPVGIKSLDYFRIYNRWGQLLFTASNSGNGWNGTFAGKEQPAGTYVFMAKATDFTGKIINKKGTIVLIR